MPDRAGILVEVTAAVDQYGNTETFYFSSIPYSTKPTDTPPDRNFLASLTDPASLGVSVYRSGRTGGYGNLEVGSIKAANPDGRYDGFKDHGIDGRRISLRLYSAGAAYADMPVLFTGTSDGPAEVSRGDLIIRFKDKQAVLDVPARPNIYGGTNVPPNGIDGSVDMKGRRQVRIYGHVLNMEPDLVNPQKLIFRVNDGPVADIPGVYDRGSPITQAADYADNAALQAATITAGTYGTCLAEGLFRLNADIQGVITNDALQGATAADRTAAQIIKQLATSAGLTDADLPDSEVDYLDSLTTAVLGLVVDEQMSVREAMSMVAESIGGFVVPDPNGVLRLGRLSDPATVAPLYELTDSQMLSIERQSQADGDVPLHGVILNHTRNWTVQDSDLAGILDVDIDRRAFLKEMWRKTAPAVDASVLLKHLLAPTVTYDSLIVDETNLTGGPADLEAKRLQSLFGISRDMYQVTIHMDVLKTQGAPALMTAVRITTPRFGLAAGRVFWLIGFSLELRRKQVKLLIWG